MLSVALVVTILCVLAIAEGAAAEPGVEPGMTTEPAEIDQPPPPPPPAAAVLPNNPQVHCMLEAGPRKVLPSGARVRR